jgi:hypothetical protein
VIGERGAITGTAQCALVPRLQGRRGVGTYLTCRGGRSQSRGLASPVTPRSCPTVLIASPGAMPGDPGTLSPDSRSCSSPHTRVPCAGDPARRPSFDTTTLDAASARTRLRAVKMRIDNFALTITLGVKCNVHIRRCRPGRCTSKVVGEARRITIEPRNLPSWAIHAARDGPRTLQRTT